MQVERAQSTVVPFFDLGPSHAPLKHAILDDVADLIERNEYVNGAPVEDFEEAWAGYCGAEYCVGVASGLDALRLGLIGLGLEPGDEVVVPALTFVATVEAVIQAGGVPVLADVSEDDYCVDPAAVEALMGPRTRAVMPVHLYGQLANLRSLGDLARRHDAWVVEDACQAHGAERNGLRAGAVGAAGAFSFYPAKNLGAMGDAGALTTNDVEIARRVRALREHGQTAKYVHEVEGYTSRLDALQALVLGRKLPLLDGWNDQRRSVVRRYSEGLDDLDELRLPPVADESDPVWHLYVVRVAAPEPFQDFLRRHDIGTGRHYPDPVHLTPAYADRFGLSAGAFPVAETIARECVSLPLFPGMTDAQVDAVVEAVRVYFGHG